MLYCRVLCGASGLVWRSVHMSKTKCVRILLSAARRVRRSLSVLHLLGGTLRLRYKGWVRLKSTRELKQLRVADAFES